MSSSIEEDGSNLQLGISASDSKRRKDLFGDCALVEIIHLHDCLRGALRALERDVQELSETLVNGGGDELVVDLERRVAGRFNVIWSVFRAHSSAEDEFIWPALQSKTQGRINRSPKYIPGDTIVGETSIKPKFAALGPSPEQHVIEQEEYEEDHADEERMFSKMDELLTQLREVLVEKRRQPHLPPMTSKLANTTTATTTTSQVSPSNSVDDTARAIHNLTKTLSKHLLAHLEKEEKQCMPLVAKHLSTSEIHDLVGKIMGKRSSDTIAQIMTMAVQNLTESDREEMVRYMKQAMEGTFFDSWLIMSGWMSSTTASKDSVPVVEKEKTSSQLASNKRSSEAVQTDFNDTKRQRAENSVHSFSSVAVGGDGSDHSRCSSSAVDITSQAELEKLIRAIAANPELSLVQKNATIQGLRDSVWKSNQRQMQKTLQQSHPKAVVATVSQDLSFPDHASVSSDLSSVAVTATCSRPRRKTPPAMYCQKTSDGKVDLVWSSYSPSSRCPDDGTVPLFSATELAPTYHDGATGAVLGCPHYARACKLRHPSSGRLYTCRLCCAQQRDMPMKDQDEPLDRYSVTEIMCMKCNALQPAGERCINEFCESYGKPFAKYFCRICHLYDDRSRPIFHCPYCNTCRSGLGLGIDFRHCMRCNACVSLSDSDHRCIPQKLQGSCPICHESMFQSTEPLRGVKCGHVMHLSCFLLHRRSSYNCPLCMRSMEDMKDHFAMLDTAVRMQPMPDAYLSTRSNIYCQDCSKTSLVQYHFVGQKCLHCGSYNTREMGRFHDPSSTTTSTNP